MDSCLYTCTQLISEIVFTNHFLEFRAASRCFQYGRCSCRGQIIFDAKTDFGPTKAFPRAELSAKRIEAELKPIGLNEPGLKAADETLRALMRRRKDREPRQEKESSRSN